MVGLDIWPFSKSRRIPEIETIQPDIWQYYRGHIEKVLTPSNVSYPYLNSHSVIALYLLIVYEKKIL